MNFLGSIPGSHVYVSSPPVYVIFGYYVIMFILLRVLEEPQGWGSKVWGAESNA